MQNVTALETIVIQDPPNSEIGGSIDVLKSDDYSTVLSVNIYSLDVKDKGEEDRNFQIMEIPQYGFMSDIGKPKLPAMRGFITIPASHGEIRATVLDSDYMVLDGDYDIYPVQKPKPGGIKGYGFEINDTVYSIDSSYPEEIISLGDLGIIRDYVVIPFEILPIQYNPSSQKIKVFLNLEVEIVYEGEAEPISLADKEISSGAFDGLYTDILLNYDSSDEWKINKRKDIKKNLIETGALTPTSNRADYLIITHDDFYDGILPLANWKKRTGLETKIVKVSEIYSEFSGDYDEAIHDFIEYAYYYWDLSPVYVLLVGDVEYVPTHYGITHPSPKDGNPVATDLYYSTVSGSDYFPDIYLGRLPVKTETELNNILDKILDYEMEPHMGDISWYKKAVVISDYQEDRPFEDTSNYVYDFLVDEGYSVSKHYKSQSTSSPSLISSSINEGSFMVNYRGHGGVVQWGTGNGLFGDYDNSDVYSLSNGRRFPIVISPTCQTGWFDGQYKDSLGEAWIKAPDNGAVGFFGSSRISYSGWNDYLDKGVYWALFDDNLYGFGQATNKAKYYMYQQVGGGTYTNLQYEIYNLLGDPEMQIWTDTPTQLSVTHSSQYYVGDSINSINVKDTSYNNIQNAKVCLYSEILNIDNCAYTSSSGNAYLYQSLSSPGAVHITVTGQNLLPYYTTARVRQSGVTTLLVDDDGASYEGYYEEALDSISHSYDLWNVEMQGYPSSSILTSYDNVIWFTGDAFTNTLTSTDRSNLQDYLDYGGNLLISGQDIGHDIGSTSFYEQYLHAEFKADDVNEDHLYGVDDDDISDGYEFYLSGGANNNNYPSRISQANGGEIIFKYSQPGGSIGEWLFGPKVAGVKYNGNYKVAYLAFPFESISGSSTRANLMNDILNWFGVASTCSPSIVSSPSAAQTNTCVSSTWNNPCDVTHHSIHICNSDSCTPPNYDTQLTLSYWLDAGEYSACWSNYDSEGNWSFYIHTTSSGTNYYSGIHNIEILDALPDTDPPTIYDEYPTNNSELSAGTASTYLWLSTDESARCRHSTTANSKFEDMSEFSYTGSAFHYFLISGLSDGGIYDYYVRCNDSSSNINLEDYYIHFTVESQDHVIHGRIYESDEATFASDLTVYITISTSSGDETLTTTTDLYGFYSDNLERLSKVWRDNDPIHIEADAGDSGSVSYDASIDDSITTQQITDLVLSGGVTTTTLQTTTSTTTTTLPTTPTSTTGIVSSWYTTNGSSIEVAYPDTHSVLANNTVNFYGTMNTSGGWNATAKGWNGSHWTNITILYGYTDGTTTDAKIRIGSENFDDDAILLSNSSNKTLRIYISNKTSDQVQVLEVGVWTNMIVVSANVDTMTVGTETMVYYNLTDWKGTPVAGYMNYTPTAIINETYSAGYYNIQVYEAQASNNRPMMPKYVGNLSFYVVDSSGDDIWNTGMLSINKTIVVNPAPATTTTTTTSSSTTSTTTTTSSTSTTTSTIVGDETTCSSCSDCSSKLDGSYDVVKLTTDLLDQTETCIQVGSGYVEFDCQGYTLSGDESAGTGVNVVDSYAIWDVTVRNCVIEDFWYGIRLLNAYSNNIIGNTVTSNNNTGIRTENSFYNTIENNTISSNQFGLFITGADYPNYITNNIVNSNSWIGIYLYDADYTGVNDNEACYNVETDFWTMNSDEMTGTNNTCDTTNNWNDSGSTGCTYGCSVVTTTSTTISLTTSTIQTTSTLSELKGDADGDGTVSDFELLDYIDRWVDYEVTDFDLLEVVDNWAG